MVMWDHLEATLPTIKCNITSMYLGLGMTISSIGNDVLIAREGGRR